MGNEDNVVLHSAMRESEILNKGGFIVRTAAESVSDEEIYRDIEFLHKLWDSTLDKGDKLAAPSIVYEDLPLTLRTMRDLIKTDIERVRMDSKETYQRVMEFARQFVPEFLGRIEYYTGEHPILDLYSVEDEIQRALDKKVQLKSGGYLIIDQTEAMTTIDINTGAFVGHRNLEETIYKTNLEAAQTIARQLRLRNLGGIIIIDFIDMQDPEHRRQVLRALEKHLDRDHSKVIISELTSLGLVQLTRKRTRESLEHILCETCPTCEGRGTIKTAETICYEIFREILREARQFDAQELLVLAAQDVVDLLVDEEFFYFHDKQRLRNLNSLQIAYAANISRSMECWNNGILEKWVWPGIPTHRISDSRRLRNIWVKSKIFALTNRIAIGGYPLTQYSTIPLFHFSIKEFFQIITSHNPVKFGLKIREFRMTVKPQRQAVSAALEIFRWQQRHRLSQF